MPPAEVMPPVINLEQAFKGSHFRELLAEAGHESPVEAAALSGKKTGGGKLKHAGIDAANDHAEPVRSAQVIEQQGRNAIAARFTCNDKAIIEFLRLEQVCLVAISIK